MTDATTDTDDLVATCCICLEITATRGQKPLYAPGCCGAWLHLECAYAIEVVGGDGKCPLCRAPAELPRRPRRQVNNATGMMSELTVRQRLLPMRRVPDYAAMLPPRSSDHDESSDHGESSDLHDDSTILP
jgi:hypothetical protein